jgi:serine/threonine protein kinase
MISVRTKWGTIITLPRILNGCYLDGVIGTGSASLVFQAHRQSTDEIVAIKVMSQSEAHQRRFLASLNREISVVQRVSHPNIIQCFEVSRYSDHIILVMEYCRDCLLDGRLPTSEARNHVLAISNPIIF